MRSNSTELCRDRAFASITAERAACSSDWEDCRADEALLNLALASSNCCPRDNAFCLEVLHALEIVARQLKFNLGLGQGSLCRFGPALRLGELRLAHVEIFGCFPPVQLGQKLSQQFSVGGSLDPGTGTQLTALVIRSDEHHLAGTLKT